MSDSKWRNIAVQAVERFNAGINYYNEGNYRAAADATSDAVTLFRTLCTVHPATFTADLAASLNNLGNSLRFLGDYQGSLKAIEEAVTLYKGLYQANPSTFTDSLARGLSNFGVRLDELGDHQLASQKFEEAVALHRKLYQDHPTSFAASLADSLNNLGCNLYKMGKRQRALQIIEEAVALHRMLYQTNPTDFAADLAKSLNNLGNQLCEVGERQSALCAAKESVALRRKLHQANPKAFTLDLAKSLKNQGAILSALGERSHALEVTEEAERLCRSLYQINQADFSADLAIFLNDLGLYLSDVGDFQRALLVQEEAVTLYRALYKAEPSAFDVDLVTSLTNFGALLSDSGEHHRALKSMEEAVALCRIFHQTSPSTFTTHLANSLSNFGVVLSAFGQRKLALETTVEATTLYRVLYQEEPSVFAANLAKSLNNWGILLNDVGDRQGALPVMIEAVELYQQLYAQEPLAFSANLACTLNNLGVTFGEVGNHKLALKVTKQAVEILRNLYNDEPSVFAANLAGSLNNLGIQFSETGEYQHALHATEEAVMLRRELCQIHPNTFAADLATSLHNLGGDLSMSGELWRAFCATAEAVALRRELYHAYPEAFAADLADSLITLGNRFTALGDLSNVLHPYREAVSLLTFTQITQWSPFVWLGLIVRCIYNLSSPIDLRTAHLQALNLLPEMRLSPLYSSEVGQAIVTVQAHLVADLWCKLQPAVEQDSELIHDVLPALVSALQSPDLQRWLIEKGKDSPEAAAVAEAESAFRRANNEVHSLVQRLRKGESDNMEGGGGMNLRHSMKISPLTDLELQEQFKKAEQKTQIARQALLDARNSLAAVDPAFAAAYRALSADDLIALLSELKQSAAPHRASTEAPAALLCLLDIPANRDIPAAIVGMLLTSDGVANRIQAVDFPDLHTLAQSCASYTPIGQRSCDVLRRLESDTIPAESINLSFDELITQLETTWWNPLQQALGENANTLGMLHICTHGVTHHLPFAAVSALRSDGNLALFQWPGLPYLRLAHTLKQTRSATEHSTTTWPNGLWQIGHDCAWTDRVPLPMAAVEASLLHRLMQANLSNKPIPSVETVIEPEQLSAQSAGLVLCAHGSGAQADDTHVRMTNGHLSTREVLERGLAPHLVLLPVCHAGQSADDAHGNALGLASGFLLAGAGVVVGSSKPVPDTYMLWFTSLLLWYVRQGLSAYEAATRARADFGADNFPEDYRTWVKSELAEAMAVLHLGGTEYQGVEQMQAQYQQSCKAAQIAGQPLPHYPLEGMIKDWPWAGFREAALPLATTDEGMRQKALSLVAARAFEDKPNSQTAAIMREMAAFIVVCGLG